MLSPPSSLSGAIGGLGQPELRFFNQIAASSQSRLSSFGPTNSLANWRKRSIATSSSIMNGDFCDVS